MKTGTTVIEYSTFHFYITWNGQEGTDQHGTRWINPEKPEPKYVKSLEELCRIFKDQVIQLAKLYKNDKGTNATAG